ncbi:MAG: carboxypeptidase regulatory-like domain-containing protein, partial [Bacteroidia bacterium]
MYKLLRTFMAGIILVMGSAVAYSQGVTTSSLSGKVTDDKGAPVFAANVVAIHTPSGTQYGTISREDGNFDIRNMRVGGPYRVEASFVGFQSAAEEEVYLQLNKTSEVKFILVETAQQLDEVVISYNQNDVINSDRTGAMTNISRAQMEAMP